VAAFSALPTGGEPPPDSGSTRDDMRELLTATIRAMRRSGVGFSIVGTVLVKERDEPMLLDLFRERIVRPRFELAAAMVRRGIERGELRSDVRLDVALPMLIGATFARHLAGLPEDEAWLEWLFDTLWEGIAAESSRTSPPGLHT
jgi:hypothetical protein